MNSIKKAAFQLLVNAQKNALVRKAVVYTASRSAKLREAMEKQEEKTEREKSLAQLKSLLTYETEKINLTEAESLFTYLQSYHYPNEPVEEMTNYLNHAFYRFLYTLDIVPKGKGKLLEIGASPYFMTLLLEKYTEYQLTFTNYFGAIPPGTTSVEVKYDEKRNKKEFMFYEANAEKDEFPFPDGHFDVVLFCEVIEHLPQDSLAALLRIKRVLKPGGYLILTTPNVARLENVVRILTGQNIYDPYSGYGVYGRHNREFTTSEMTKLLDHCGFEVEKIFTSDVTPNHVFHQYPVQSLLPFLKGRDHLLGEYIFTLSRNIREPSSLKPRWLYRSYPDSELGE